MSSIPNKLEIPASVRITSPMEMIRGAPYFTIKCPVKKLGTNIPST